MQEAPIPSRILIIEDDRPTNDKFHNWLARTLFSVSVQQCFDLESGARAVQSDEYDLVISDVDLGKPDDKYGGVKIAGMLHGKQTPVLIVSGLPQPELHRDILMALDAWDYLQKPVGESDFLNQARRALQWRRDRLQASQLANPKSEDPDLQLDPLGRTKATWKAQRVNLSITHMRIVDALLTHANQPVPYGVLVELLDSGRNTGNLRVHVQTIRTAFKDVDPAFNRIVNVPMLGYTWRV